MTLSLLMIVLLAFSLAIPVDSSGSDGSDWTFQEGFCQHAEKDDSRLNIHSFMIAHGKLYIMVAMCYFVVDLGPPPFNVSHGGIFGELSNELPNNVVRTYRTTGYLFTSFAIDLNDDWEMLMMSFTITDVTSTDLEYHTQSILRRVDEVYQPKPGTYPIAINAYFGNDALVNGTTRCQYHLDRFISAVGYMFLVQRRIADDNSTTTNYIFRYDIKPNLNISIEEYFLRPTEENSQTEWYLESEAYYYFVNNHTNRTLNDQMADREFAVRIMKNGYITQDMMFLTTMKQLEKYKLEYPLGPENRSRIAIKYVGGIRSSDVITCKEDTTFNYKITIGMGLFFFMAILLIALYVITSKTSMNKGHRFVVGPRCTLFEITDENLYKLKKN